MKLGANFRMPAFVDELRQINQLDPRDPGRWPFSVRVLAAFGAFLAITLVLSFLFVWRAKSPELEAKRAEELTLRDTFRRLMEPQLDEVGTTEGTSGSRGAPSRTWIHRD